MTTQICVARRRRCRTLSATLALLSFTAAAAEDSAGEALASIKPLVDARLRFEHVDQTSVPSDGEALTLRTRIGFETGMTWKTALLAEGEFVWALDDQYDNTTNGKRSYPVIADPAGHEINRLQLTNVALPQTTVTLGRQRIALDDHRFVGNVGWRQNEQTFDSLRIVNRSVEDLTVDVAYVNQVNRVFGHESPQGRYDGDTWLTSVSYQFPVGKLTGFGYAIEIEPDHAAPAAVRDSSQTFGIRFAGDSDFGSVKVAYVGSYARQQEYADNPLSIDLRYALGEVTMSVRGFSIGAGVETLEGNGIKSFTTPLATLHKFQGWADKFAATPPNGIEDRYASAGWASSKTALFDALSVVATYHHYKAERGALEFGSETNVLLQAKRQRWSGALKYAGFDATHWLTDTTKWWVQLEYVW